MSPKEKMEANPPPSLFSVLRTKMPPALLASVRPEALTPWAVEPRGPERGGPLTCVRWRFFRSAGTEVSQPCLQNKQTNWGEPQFLVPNPPDKNNLGGQAEPQKRELVVGVERGRRRRPVVASVGQPLV